MIFFRLMVCLCFSYSLINAQVFDIKNDWNLVGATEDIDDLSVFDSTCVNEIFTYSSDKTWKSYPRDSTFTALKAAQGFWIYAKTSCSVDTKSTTDSGNNGILDITNKILTNKSANCSDYVRKYGSSVKDIQENQYFTGIFEITLEDNQCVFTSNSIPNHNFNDTSARFATKVSTQSLEMKITASPSFASSVTNLVLGYNGMMLNGVKLDMLAAGCYGVGNGKIGCNSMSSPFRYDPMSPNVSFGTDQNNAHTQPSGTYHYHGSPNALFDKSGNVESPIIGFAIDGFPIFGSYFKKDSQVIKATSSYKLKIGTRQSINGIDPGGTYDGSFRDDYEYVHGSGTLDECNGMSIDGVYGYYITDSFPWAIGCYKGNVPDNYSDQGPGQGPNKGPGQKQGQAQRS